MPTWFDESRLDDEAALATADSACATRRGGCPRPPRGGEAAPGSPPPWVAGDAARPRAIVAPAPTPGCCGRARAVVPGAVRRLARSGSPGWAGALTSSSSP
jgi:hypothetical protein